MVKLVHIDVWAVCIHLKITVATLQEKVNFES